MKNRKKYLQSVYIIIMLIGVVFIIISVTTENEYLESLFQNFSTELLGVVFIFLLINYFLINDEWQLTEQVKKLIEQNENDKQIYAEDFFSQNNIFSKIEESVYDDVKSIKVAGYSLTRLTRQNTGFFSRLIEKGVDFEFIILDYTDKNVINQISKRTSDNLTKDLWKTRLKDAHSMIIAIRNSLNAKGKVDARFIPYVQGFGIMFINRFDDNNDCFVTMYPHKSGAMEPAFRINNRTDPYWYNFFKDQYEIFWGSSKEIEP